MADSSNGFHGFVAGVFSGVTKSAVGHPFDTVKVRMQTNPRYAGVFDCVKQTFKYEGIRGFYKGLTPPLVGWVTIDSVMFTALTHYRGLVHRHLYPDYSELPARGKAIVHVAAGWTVSLIAAPPEHIKALLQVQYTTGTAKYKGPIDCLRQLVRGAGVRHGVYHGLFATMVFRTNFIFWWGSYDLMSGWFTKNTNMSPAAINFWAGGLAACVFWTTAYPSDVVKQKIMCDDVTNVKYRTWIEAVKGVYASGGVQAFGRGYLPALLRSFPANAAALTAFGVVMRLLEHNSYTPPSEGSMPLENPMESPGIE